MSEIIIDKNAKQITFTNNGIGFSQFGIANEILDLIENQENEIKRLNKELQDTKEHLGEYLHEQEEENKRLNDKIEDDKMIIEGNWGCIDNLRKDYNAQKKEIKRLNNIINKALEKSKGLQYKFGYVLDDLVYLLMQGSDKE